MSDFLKIFREVQKQGRSGSLEQPISSDGNGGESPFDSASAEYEDPEERAIIESRMKNTGNSFLDMYSLMEKQKEVQGLRIKKSNAEGEKNLANRNEFMRGLYRGADTLQATYQGGLGMLSSLAGDEVGARERFRAYQDEMRQASENPRTEMDLFSTDAKTGAFGSLSNFGTYAAGTLGEAVPSLAESVLSGIAGAALGAAIIPAPDPGDVVTVPVGAVGGLIGKGAIKKAIASTAAQYAKQGVAADAAEQLAKQYVGREVAKRVGAVAANTAVTGLHEGGGMYAEGLQQGYDSPGTAAALGVASGLSESLLGAAPGVLKAFAGRSGVDEIARQKGVRAAAGYLWDIVKESGQEGVQEGFQEFLGSVNQEINDPNFNLFTKENFMRWAEAAGAGAVVGGAVRGGVVGTQLATGRGRSEGQRDFEPRIPSPPPESDQNELIFKIQAERKLLERLVGEVASDPEKTISRTVAKQFGLIAEGEKTNPSIRMQRALDKIEMLKQEEDRLSGIPSQQSPPPPGSVEEQAVVPPDVSKSDRQFAEQMAGGVNVDEFGEIIPPSRVPAPPVADQGEQQAATGSVAPDITSAAPETTNPFEETSVLDPNAQQPPVSQPEGMPSSTNPFDEIAPSATSVQQPTTRQYPVQPTSSEAALNPFEVPLPQPVQKRSVKKPQTPLSQNPFESQPSQVASKPTVASVPTPQAPSQTSAPAVPVAPAQPQGSAPQSSKVKSQVPAPAKLLDRLESIEELNAVLDNWSADDKRPKTSYSTKELLDLAKSRLNDFSESGHSLAEDLTGDNGPEAKKYATKQRSQIKTWIKIAEKEAATASDLGAPLQLKAAESVPSSEPAAPSQDVIIGERLTIAGKPAVRSSSVMDQDNVRYELFKDEDAGGGTIRSTDMDSGNVVFIRTYQDFEKARGEYSKLEDSSKSVAQPPAPVATENTDSVAPSVVQKEQEAVRKDGAEKPVAKKKPVAKADQEVSESPEKTYLSSLSEEDLQDLADAVGVKATKDARIDELLANPQVASYLKKVVSEKKLSKKKRRAAPRDTGERNIGIPKDLQTPQVVEVPSKDFTEDERKQERILKKLGVTLRLTESGNQDLPGMFIGDSRTIWYDRDYLKKWDENWKEEGRPEKAMTWGLFAHEMFHAIKQSSPKAWRSLYNWVRKNDPEGLGKARVAYLADQMRIGNEEYVQKLLSDEDLRNDEGLSRYLEDRAAYFKFWNELGKERPGLLAKIGRWVRRVLRFAEPGVTNPDTLAGQARLAIERAMKRHNVAMTREGVVRAAVGKDRGVENERKARTLDEVRSRVAKDYSLTVSSEPMRMIDGKSFSSLDPDAVGAGLLVQDADAAMQRMMSESLQEAGVPDEIASTVKVPSSAEVDYAFRLTNGSRYWYELSATGFVKDFFSLSRKLTERLIDIVAGTSGGQKPTDNLRVAVASMAQDMQGRPVSVGTRDESSLTAALSPAKLETHKFGNFSDTMQVLGGLRPGVKPLPTIDLQMAKVFGVQHAAIASDPRMYEAMSRFLIKLRDAQNASLKNGEQPYESWQIQALLWVAQRDTSDPDSFNIGMPKIVAQLKKAGIPTPKGKITEETLMDPRTSDVLAPTSKIIPEAYTATVETRTKLTKVGKESAEVFDEIKAIDAPWARNLVEEFEKIQRRTMRAIGNRRPPKPGNKTRQKSVASMLLSVIMNKSPNSHELSRVDTDAWGTFEGNASPNIRFPLNLGAVGDTEEGGGTKRYVPTKDHREQFLSVLGKYFKQKSQAASEFIPADLGSHDTFSILVRRYDKVGITEAELAEISDGLGRPISYKQVPNGWQLDINIGGFDETAEQKAENRDVQRIHAVMQEFASKGAIFYQDLPRSYDSSYIEKSDYNKHIRRLEDEIRRNADTGGSGEAVGDTPERRASDYAAVVELIKGIAAKQESAFKKWTKDARELAAKRNVQLGNQRGADSGQRYSPGRRSESTRDGRGLEASRRYSPLEGAPSSQGATGPDPRIVDAAEQYARENGISLKRQAEYVKVDEDRAKRIAQAFENMTHSPDDPAVKEAYDDLILQTKAQYDALAKAGYTFTFYDGKTDPYDGNPMAAIRDLRQNKTMAVYGTYDGYGTEGITDAALEGNPMLADTGLRWKDQSGVSHPVVANDLFRAVHDAFGHSMEGAGFRARGEENAWQAHVRLYYGPAIGAMTSETRGQNSWLNFGPYAEKNKTAGVLDTVFAENKIGLMPEWTWTEGKAADMESVGDEGDGDLNAPDLDAGTRFGVARPEIAKKLNSGKKVTLYRAMVEIDGNLYPPMSSKVKDDTGKLKMRAPEPIGKWMQAEERPDLVPKTGKYAGKFPLKKSQGTTWAAYAPYFHGSPVPLNDQFTAAWKNDGIKRPRMVIVEVEIPASELTSGYQAEGSKKKTGVNKWNSGVVGSKLPNGRDVVLSRYVRIKRVVPDAEVAKKIAELVVPNRLSIPVNTVTPQLRAELEKNGVRISPKGTKGDDVRYSPGRKKKDDILAGLYKHLEKEGVIKPQVAGERTTSIKNRKTDELRAESGLPPRVRPTRESLEMWEEEARRRYPTAKDRLQLVAEIEKDPERLGKIESAAIGQHIAYLDNQRRAGKDVFDELRRTIKAANIGGTEAGRALVSRKAERFSDYSLAGLVNEHFSVVGSDPTDAQMQEYSELANRIEKLEKDKVDLAKKLAKETIARKKAEAELPPKQNPPQEKTGTKRATLLKKVADGFAAFQNAWGGKGSDRAAVGRQTETSAFKKWFGDSKVVDENGDPLVVYHGSPNANINNFKTWGWGASNAAFFSSDPDEAKHSRGKQSAVYPVYLSLKNPLILNAQDKKSVLGEVDQENELIGQSAADGYDGIIWKDALNDITTYAVFEPTQIKSATGNRGTFDSNNPDIRYSPGRQEPDIKSAAASLVATLREAGVSSMLELESQVNANMPNITPEQMQVIKDAWEESNKKDKVTSPIGANPQRADIAARAKELMRSAIELGYGAEKENWMDVVDVVHDQLSLEVPGIDKYDTMQAISDYGVWRELPPEQVEVIIRAVRGKARQSLKIEDALKAISQSNAWLKSGVSPEEVATRLRDQGLLPKATGQERATPDSIERDLIAEFNKLKKTLPVPAESREGQLKSALTTAKTAASNRLEMLDKDIASLQEAVDNRKELAKPVAEKSRLEPDAELASLRSQLEEKRRQRDELKAQYEKIFPDTSPKKGRKQLTDEQKIEASVKLLRRQIDAVKADVQSLIDGTWVAAGKSAELTSERKEELKAELALLRASQKQARQASPAYQAREEAKYWERYRKSQEKRLAFWMKRRDEAQAGRLPVPLQKRTITEKSIIQKNMEIEEAQYEAMIAIEKANRATWNAGQWIGQGILEATSLIPKTLMLGMEMSFVLRQGFFYTYSQPMKAFNALVESMPAVFSQRLALASMENIESRANAQEYHLAGVDFTSATGPKAKLEEMYQSSIMQWLERTETKLLLPLRTWAKVYAMFERGNRTFSNIMKADMYDIQKRDTLAAREFFGTNTDWTDNDIKQVGRTVNIFSGRGTGLKGGNPWLDWLFLARRWTWSRIQADFIVPFQLATPQWIGQWNADRGMRVALAKLYIQAMVGHAAKMAAAYFAYSVLAGDDEEEKPTMEFDLRSSDALALKIGETRFKDEGGLMPAVVLAARLLTGEIKTGKGEIKSIYGADVDYGGKTAADFVINYGRYKLGTAPSAILEWISGRDAVGNVMTKTDIVKSRLTPLTWREIYAAESELGLKRGTLAALEAFFGVSVSTHGDETKYKKANETDRLKQFETDLKRMEWDSPDPPYKDLLTADQMEKVKSQRDHKKQSVVYEAFVNPVRKNYKSDDSYKEAVEKRDKFLVEFKKSGLSFEESRKLLIDYWKRNYGSPYETKNGVSTLKEGITNRLRQLRKTLSGN